MGNERLNLSNGAARCPKGQCQRFKDYSMPYVAGFTRRSGAAEGGCCRFAASIWSRASIAKVRAMHPWLALKEKAARALLKLCGKTPFFLKPLSQYETADLERSQLSTGKSKGRGPMLSFMYGELLGMRSPYKSELHLSVVLIFTHNDLG